MPIEKAHPESIYRVKERQLHDLEDQILQVAVVGEALFLVKASVQEMVDNHKADYEKLSAGSFSMAIFQRCINDAVKSASQQIEAMRVKPAQGSPSSKAIENKSK